MRDSWFHFNILKKSLRWCGEHGHTHTPLATTTMPPFSFSLASSVSSSFSFFLLSPQLKHFLFLWEEKKGKKLIRSCNKTMFLQGDVTQLTTILTRSK